MSKTKIDLPSQITYFIIDEIVSNHFVHLEKIEEMTSQIEEEVVEESSPTNAQENFQTKI